MTNDNERTLRLAAELRRQALRNLGREAEADAGDAAAVPPRSVDRPPRDRRARTDDVRDRSDRIGDLLALAREEPVRPASISSDRVDELVAEVEASRNRH